ncbi:MAG: T9SS type A sorting domain-containing protein [Bacteroidia bacterium]|nr:T9SS type A sorting domain-containing protein [Bacteroidia bacterium]
MKTLYPSITKTSFFLLFVLLTNSFLNAQTKLSFTSHSIISGTDNTVGVKYRFPSVTTNTDAIVRIDSLVNGATMSEIDQASGYGHDAALQPYVYTPGGNVRSYAVLSVTFVNAGTNTAKTVNDVSVTAIDIDGNSTLKEFCAINLSGGAATFSGNGNDIKVTSGYYGYQGQNIAGTEYDGIDTLANGAMFTVKNLNVGGMTLRCGSYCTGSGSATRQHSFLMQSVQYIAPITLPVILEYFTANLKSNTVAVNWEASVETNFSHYILQRSYSGNEFADIATIFGTEVAGAMKYSYNDASVNTQSQVVYYRLLMVDKDGKAKYSSVRMIRFGKQTENTISIITYPNPVSNELRITIPNNWQNKKVTYEVFNSNAQVSKKLETANSSQTESINVSVLAPGFYVVRVMCEGQIAQQKIIKQ